MDGPELVKELRRRDPDIKVIFISGYAEETFRAELDQDEDVHFLPKPFNLRELAAKVKEVIGRGRAQAAREQDPHKRQVP
jgi:two-component system cell cycle sensor histidine kinase/response regulator CckA